MSDDIAIIKQIEKQIGEKLTILPLVEIWRENFYVLNTKARLVQGLYWIEE